MQDVYLRWHAVDRAAVRIRGAFLTTATTRVCLDVLRSARARREEYVGPWLPEPVVDTGALAPDAHTEPAEDLSIALLLALDRLSPLERAAFLLHDVFDCSYSEVGARWAAAKRRAVNWRRGRGRTREARPRGESAGRDRADEATTKHEKLLSAFVDASRSGDLDALMNMLAADARLVADGGGKVQAALNVIEGAERISRFIVGVAPRGLEGTTLRFHPVNGLPGLVSTRPTVPCRPSRSRSRTIASARSTACAIRTSSDT